MAELPEMYEGHFIGRLCTAPAAKDGPAASLVAEGEVFSPPGQPVQGQQHRQLPGSWYSQHLDLGCQLHEVSRVSLPSCVVCQAASARPQCAELAGVASSSAQETTQGRISSSPRWTPPATTALPRVYSGSRQASVSPEILLTTEVGT